MELIVCQNVSFAYDGSLAASQLNFTIKSGDYLCIVGENGSGKSTLLKGLLRLKRPHGGRIDFASGLAGIGYLPQQTAAQKDFPASVYEVVLSGRLSFSGWKPFYSQTDKKIAVENMRKLGIANLHDKCYRELSGGQQQRALLARALCAARQLLLLDEPTNGLDPLMARDMQELLRKLNQEERLTIALVSHDVHTAVRQASHILHLHNQQLFFGTAQAYRRSKPGRAFLTGGCHV